MERTRYDGLAASYAAFLDAHAPFYETAESALRRLLGPGPGRCVDLGCGTGRFLATLADLGWDAVGVDESADQLRLARAAGPQTELVRSDVARTPLPAASFDACVSTFTHTDVDDFAGLVAEARRLLRSGGRFVYVGNHPCFVGPVQEHVDGAPPRLHPGYRRRGRWQAEDAPGTSRGGWREQLGSFVHVPLADFLTAFAGLTLLAVEEPDDGSDYPKTLGIAAQKP